LKSELLAFVEESAGNLHGNSIPFWNTEATFPFMSIQFWKGLINQLGKIEKEWKPQSQR
jgi:hypothetical protein